MRILLDECVPKRLATALIGHQVATVRQMGWSGKENGELLALIAAAGFEVLLTVDRNIPYQQVVASLPFALVILVATSNKISALLPLIPATLAALTTIKPGELVEIR